MLRLIFDQYESELELREKKHYLHVVTDAWGLLTEVRTVLYAGPTLLPGIAKVQYTNNKQKVITGEVSINELYTYNDDSLSWLKELKKAQEAELEVIKFHNMFGENQAADMAFFGIGNVILHDGSKMPGYTGEEAKGESPSVRDIVDFLKEEAVSKPRAGQLSIEAPKEETAEFVEFEEIEAEEK